MGMQRFRITQTLSLSTACLPGKTWYALHARDAL